MCTADKHRSIVDHPSVRLSVRTDLSDSLITSVRGKGRLLLYEIRCVTSVATNQQMTKKIEQNSYIRLVCFRSGVDLS